MRKREAIKVAVTAFIFFQLGISLVLPIFDRDASAAYGDIGAVIDSLEYSANAQVYSEDALHRINETEYYVAVVRGADLDGFIYTFHIWDNGTIDGIVDSWEYDTGTGTFGTLIQKPGTNLWVVARRTPSPSAAKGKLTTFRVNDNGTIQKTAIDYAYTYNDDTDSLSSRPAMLWMGDYLILAADDDSTLDGWLYSYLVYDNGTISGLVDTEEFNNDYGRFANLELVDDDTILLSYAANEGAIHRHLMTYNVTDGVFEDTYTDYWYHDTGSLFGNLERIGTNTFAVIFTAQALNAIACKTFNVSDEGDITHGYIDTLTVYTAGACSYMSSFKVADPLVYGDGVLGVAFKGVDDDGFIVTLNCTSAGIMPASTYDIIEYDTTLNYFFPSVVSLGENSQMYAVLSDQNTKGFIRTISIESPLTYAFQTTSSGYFTFSNTSADTEIVSGFFSLQNTSAFSDVSSGYFSLSNTSSFVSPMEGWFSFSNSSDYTDVLSGYFVFQASRTLFNISDGYFLFENSSAFTGLFEGFFTFSNTSSLGTLSEGWFSFHDGDPSWKNIPLYYSFELYERYTGLVNTGYTFYGALWGSQGFTPTTSHYVEQIDVFIYRFDAGGTYNGNVNIAIRATSDGKPTGPNLANGSILASSLPTAGVWISFTLDTPLYVVSGTTYAIVISYPSGTVTSRMIFRIYNADGYAGGVHSTSSNSGSTWSAKATDARFMEYGRISLSTYDHTWFTFGNTASLQSITSGYFSFANVSSVQELYDGWFSFQNSVDWLNTTSGWFTFQNSPSFTSYSEGYFLFSNTSTDTTIGEGYFTFQNPVSWYGPLDMTGWFTFANSSAFTLVQEGFFTFSNSSANTTISEGWFTFRNIPGWNTVRSGYFRFSNTSYWVTLNSGWFRFENSSNATPIVSIVSPRNSFEPFKTPFLVRYSIYSSKKENVNLSLEIILNGVSRFVNVSNVAPTEYWANGTLDVSLAMADLGIVSNYNTPYYLRLTANNTVTGLGDYDQSSFRLRDAFYDLLVMFLPLIFLVLFSLLAFWKQSKILLTATITTAILYATILATQFQGVVDMWFVVLLIVYALALSMMYFFWKNK